MMVGEGSYAGGQTLGDTPGSPRGLSQGMERIAGLVELDRRDPQQVESCLDQLGMTDDNLDSIRDLLLVPLLPFQRRDRGTQDSYTEARLTENPFQPLRYIMLSSEGSEDLAPPALAQLFTNILDELSFLGVQFFLRKIGRGGDQERYLTFVLRIETLAPDLS